IVVLFFFSSERRHTRFSRDWSSDVCSSDLEAEEVDPENAIDAAEAAALLTAAFRQGKRPAAQPEEVADAYANVEPEADEPEADKIGRASCREREQKSTGAVSTCMTNKRDTR